jgi:hypothetical protein
MTESTPPPDQRWSTDEPAASDAARASTPAASTAAVVTQGRPGIVTAGSITLIVLGALGLLIGVAALLFGGVLAGGGAGEIAPGFEGMMGAFGGMLIFIAILVLVFGALEVWAGINALGGRSWARITGIVLSVIGAAMFVGGLFTSGAGADAGQGANPILNIVFIAAYAFVIYAFATGGRWFSARSA